MLNRHKTGVLLVNLGTPLSPAPRHVFRYLNEFLTDGRVIDLPWLKRQLLVRGCIVPLRYRQSAEAYRQLWTTQGSPLLIHGLEVQHKLQVLLGEHFQVSLAMRYQVPSIATALQELKESHIDALIVLPLFPQYASATTGSVHQKVMELLKNWEVIPQLTLINSFADHPAFIQAFVERASPYLAEPYDHVLFSFHGLPEQQIRKADHCGKCLKQGCCDQLTGGNRLCYKAQCHMTARAIADGLALSSDRYTICFQSRLGKDPWIQPYTSEMIEKCAIEGRKRLLVLCPAFVCDCLETTVEITHEYGQLFKARGGECLQLVEGLNSHPAWIRALHILVSSTACQMRRCPDEKGTCSNSVHVNH